MDQHQEQNVPLEEPASLPSVGNSEVSSDRQRNDHNKYSKNPNTVRVRQRNAKLTPIQLAVERAKANDSKAVNAAWKHCKATDAFLAASDEAKKNMLKQAQDEVMARRRNRGIDYDSRIAAITHGLASGENASSLPANLDVGNMSNPQPVMAAHGYLQFHARPPTGFTGGHEEASFPALGPDNSNRFTVHGESPVDWHEPEDYHYEALRVQIDQMTAEVQKLRGVVEETTHQLAEVISLLQRNQQTQPTHLIYTPPIQDPHNENNHEESDSAHSVYPTFDLGSY
ncbi:hypothetical protein ONZ43_g3708 [Nemania bipapillata]|uniref:Uncharacterized protein n=1 Tax=Nemania bipapillata TaxID=110536 RepID=A0ACC2IVT1_9PEZI|nr:hypothetical protein ONZ43_g3708 [Nemania bipapillata]